MGKVTPESRVFEAPGLTPADALRADAIVRLELLRIVFAHRPQWDVGLCEKAAGELEKFVAGK